MLRPVFASSPLFRISALTALALAANLASAQDVQTVKIAHAGPVSGGIAHIGKDTENGVRLAIDDLNAQNLVIGGKKIKFEIAAEDDAGDPRATRGDCRRGDLAAVVRRRPLSPRRPHGSHTSAR